MGVSRRFSDFILLEQDIRSSNPGSFCPSTPRFKIELYSSLPADVVDAKLKEMLLCFLVKVAHHPTLSKDVNFQRFFESRGPYTALATSKANTVASFLKTVTKSVTKVKDMDSWYESHRQDMSVLCSAFEKSIRTTEKLMKAHKG